MDSVDLYCERVGEGFWAEPINALTNIGFFIASWGVWRLSRRSSTLSPGIWLLIATAVAIGSGSFVFHTIATNWARVLDVLPILIFQSLFLWLYGRRIIGLTRPTSGLLLAGFLAAAILGRQFPAILHGSLIYAPALLTILGLGLYHARTMANARFDLLGAAGVLTVSLFFRTIDNAVCTAFPYGTHFLWHLGNGLVVYLAVRALALQQRKTAE